MQERTGPMQFSNLVEQLGVQVNRRGKLGKLIILLQEGAPFKRGISVVLKEVPAILCLLLWLIPMQCCLIHGVLGWGAGDSPLSIDPGINPQPRPRMQESADRRECGRWGECQMGFDAEG